MRIKDVRKMLQFITPEMMQNVFRVCTKMRTGLNQYTPIAMAETLKIHAVQEYLQSTRIEFVFPTLPNSQWITETVCAK